jgi:hypothetical protein
MIRAAGTAHAFVCAGLIVVLWRAGLHEALALADAVLG